MASIIPSNNYLNNSTLDPHIVTLLIGVETSHMVLFDDVYQSTRGIAVSAILFHIIWGLIFGFVISSLLRIQAYRWMKSKKIERFSTQYQIYVYRGITVRFNYL